MLRETTVKDAPSRIQPPDGYISPEDLSNAVIRANIKSMMDTNKTLDKFTVVMSDTDYFDLWKSFRRVGYDRYHLVGIQDFISFFDDFKIHGVEIVREEPPRIRRRK